MDPWRSPQWVGDASRGSVCVFPVELLAGHHESRVPAPVQTEAGTVPFDYGPGPNNRKRIKNAREEAIETNENQSVDGTEGLFPGGGSSQNNYLLPQR
jgi:hypothetical protein